MKTRLIDDGDLWFQQQMQKQTLYERCIICGAYPTTLENAKITEAGWLCDTPCLIIYEMNE